MQAYKLVLPEGAAEGLVVWVTVDPKTRTATCVADDEVKAEHTRQKNRLVGVVKPASLADALGPHEAAWPDVVREILRHRSGGSVTVEFVDYARNPRSFVTHGGVYEGRLLDVPSYIHDSAKVHYAAFFAPEGDNGAALRRFTAAVAGWTPLGSVEYMELWFHLFTIQRDTCPEIQVPGERLTWMKWSESAIVQHKGTGLYDVRSFCAVQMSPYRISVRKNEQGHPVAVVIAADRQATNAVTVYPTAEKGRERMLPTQAR